MPPSDNRRTRRQKGRSASKPHRTASAPTNGATTFDEAQKARYAPTAWAKAGNSGFTELQCPSGQFCLVRRPGVQGLMAAGVLHSMDTLAVLVDDGIRAGTGQPPRDTPEITLKTVMDNPGALESAMHMTHRIVQYCVVAPTLALPLSDPTNRRPDVVYVDDVDEVDLMYILNYVMGGTKDLERFREGFAENVRSLESQSTDAGTTE